LVETPENEIRLSHQIGDSQISSYKDALNAAQEGQEIKIGFQAGDKFHTIITTSKNTDMSSVEGFVQKGVIDGLIAPQKKRVGNKYYLQGEGQNIERQAVSMEILQSDARARLGSQSIKRSGNTFTLTKTLNQTTVYDKSGNPVFSPERNALYPLWN